MPVWGDTSFATIVGVVSSINNSGPEADALPEIDYPYSRADGDATTLFNIMVRVQHGDPALMTPAVRAAVRSVDSQAALTRIMPMSDVLQQSVRRPRLLDTIILRRYGRIAA